MKYYRKGVTIVILLKMKKSQCRRWQFFEDKWWSEDERGSQIAKYRWELGTGIYGSPKSSSLVGPTHE